MGASMSPRRTAADEARKVGIWNRHHPVGTPCVYTNDLGVETASRTRSEAMVLGGHTAVVWIDGVSGCVSLDRVRPVTP